jgi:CRP-like cAMP-binding protein
MDAQPVTLEEVISFLLETPLFEDLDPTELAEMVQIMQVQRLREGQILFREGDPGDAWYVIFRGACVVTKDAAFGPARTLALLDPQSCFGEMAVLDGSARSAGVSVREDTTLFKFPREDFQSLLDAGSLSAYKLVAAMARVLTQRQRNLTQQLSEVMENQGASGAIREQLQDLVDEYKVSE